MAHDHPLSHPATSSPRNKRELWWVLLLCSSYMIAEIVGGLISHSLALLADAGHMAIDTAAIGLSLFASWIAQKPATDEKTYGYYRAEILAALLNGATLVAISIGIFIESWRRLNHPPEIQGQVMIVVAIGGLVVNLIGLYLMHRRSHENLNMHGVWLHLLTDTLGSLAAIVAAFLIWHFGWNLADPIISMAISALILFGSWKLLSECVNVLLEGVPKGMDVGQIKQGIEALEGVQGVHDLHVWTVTSGVPALSAHVRVMERVDHGVVLQSVTALLRDRHHIEHVTLQLEPPTFTHPDSHLCFK